MDTATILCGLFEGSDLAYGQTVLSPQADASGKREARHWTVKEKATVKQWEEHLAGQGPALGLPPINSKNMCRWCALDIDSYGDKELHLRLAKGLHALGIQALVTYSKSGGAHVFVILDTWIKASIAIARMQEIAARLGHARAEIFPKQSTLNVEGANIKEYGNWISMPFWGGRNSVVLIHTATGPEAISLPEFIEKREQWVNKPGNFTERLATNGDIFPEGPPCLNMLFQDPDQTGHRNVLLANAAVYAKKAFPDHWQEMLMKYNGIFTRPLQLGEVQTLVRSYSKKEYRYQCKLEPLKSHCAANVCSQCKFGIDQQGILPNNRSLSKIETEPPIWYLDVTTPDGTIKRMSLTTEQLQYPVAFQKRCMEVLDYMPQLPKRDEWTDQVREMMSTMKVTPLDIPANNESQFMDHLEEFFDMASKSPTPEDLLRGLPYYHEGFMYFRYCDLTNMLFTYRFNALSGHQIMAALIMKVGASASQIRVRDRNVNVWKVERKGNQPRNQEETPY